MSWDLATAARRACDALQDIGGCWGEGLEVLNFHRNGSTRSFDDFLDDAGVGDAFESLKTALLLPQRGDNLMDSCSKCNTEARNRELREMPAAVFHATYTLYGRQRAELQAQYLAVDRIILAYERELDLRQQEVNAGTRDDIRSEYNITAGLVLDGPLFGPPAG